MQSPSDTLSPAAPPGVDSQSNRHHRIPTQLLIILAASLSVTFLIALLLISFLIYRKFSRKRTAPSDNDRITANHPRQFSYSLLRRCTASFSSSNRLGHGGFGSVYKATLPSGLSLAVKVMDPPGSLQGERDFHNELSICSALSHPNIVSLLGHSSDRQRRTLLLVYELMPNRSLQDALFGRKCSELMDWHKRFEIVVGVALGLQYLHHSCHPPLVHSDIKPSNILLDADFRAKIGDFGLARLKTEDGFVEEECEDKERVKAKETGDETGSIVEGTESVLTLGNEENAAVDRSPESCVIKIVDSDAASDVVAAAGEKTSVSEGCYDKFSVESGKEFVGRKKGGSGRDWWWKQDNGGGESETGRVDYVMEWIRSEIKKERPKSEWVASPSSNASSSGKFLQKKQRKRFDWWSSLHEERIRKEKNRKPREWWKEEFYEELTKKKKKKRELNSSSAKDFFWQRDDDLVQERKKRRSKSSRGSADWWLDGFSGDLRSGRRNSQDCAASDTPKSGGVSSTPSMRGTVCYIAPECGGAGLPSEKSDVYSFGVLVMVLVSGRRPLQVVASPKSEFDRANLISWARQLARNGRLLDLVDPCLHSVNKEQALLCITTALLCLQRSPGKRPTMNEIVATLSGEAEPPHLPFELSPSPPSKFPFKSTRKAR